MAMMNEMEYRTIGSALAGGYRAAVYCRLSKDDDLQGESASIANQRDMLEKYCEKQGWEVVAVYQDDGFTGLNMERPDLQRMLRAIERRQINLVITKDLSRLGRNYLQTGHLIEDFFPRNGVRYIAMNDGTLPCTRTVSAKWHSGNIQRALPLRTSTISLHRQTIRPPFLKTGAIFSTTLTQA